MVSNLLKVHPFQSRRFQILSQPARPCTEYNAIEQDDFWGRHQDIVAARLVQLIDICGETALKMSWDSAQGTLRANEREHVRDLRRVLTALGPAFIKLGQGLSARPDILSKESMVGMCNRL